LVIKRSRDVNRVEGFGDQKLKSFLPAMTRRAQKYWSEYVQRLDKK
jgi:hypothetical protein